MFLTFKNYVSFYECKDTMKKAKNLLFFIDFYIF